MRAPGDTTPLETPVTWRSSWRSNRNSTWRASTCRGNSRLSCSSGWSAVWTGSESIPWRSCTRTRTWRTRHSSTCVILKTLRWVQRHGSHDYKREWLVSWSHVDTTLINRHKPVKVKVMASGGSRISQTQGGQPWVWDKNLLFNKIFPENCMKMKEIATREGHP